MHVVQDEMTEDTGTTRLLTKISQLYIPEQPSAEEACREHILQSGREANEALRGRSGC